MTEPSPTANDRTVTVRVPISIRRRGGRKHVLAPDGTNVTMVPVRRHIDNAIVKAIARAFRWREMLENGTYATIAEIATAERSQLHSQCDPVLGTPTRMPAGCVRAPARVCIPSTTFSMHSNYWRGMRAMRS
jgi:hypothetical protein